MLGVFLLPPFACLGYECQDFLSPATECKWSQTRPWFILSSERGFFVVVVVVVVVFWFCLFVCFVVVFLFCFVFVVFFFVFFFFGGGEGGGTVRWNACVHRVDLALYSHPKDFGRNGVRTHANSMGKILSTGKKFSSEEDRTYDAASSRTASPTHYQLSVPLNWIFQHRLGV